MILLFLIILLFTIVSHTMLYKIKSEVFEFNVWVHFSILSIVVVGLCCQLTEFKNLYYLIIPAGFGVISYLVGLIKLRKLSKFFPVNDISCVWGVLNVSFYFVIFVNAILDLL